MSVSTDGQICYGILLDEDTDLPWDDDEFEGDIDNWWTCGILGFRHSFEMFTPEGDWIGGQEWPAEKRREYYDEKQAFEESHTELPVRVVNYCSYDFPMYILAIPETCNRATRGYPSTFNPEELSITDEQRAALIEFCRTYGIEFAGEPAWYLSSCWG
jgi:hypothetical protein